MRLFAAPDGNVACSRCWERTSENTLEKNGKDTLERCTPRKVPGRCAANEWAGASARLSGICLCEDFPYHVICRTVPGFPGMKRSLFDG